MVVNYTYHHGKWVLNRDLEKTKQFRDVFGKLPNRLVMDIIRTADGGKNTHKSKYNKVMTELQKSIIQDEYGDEVDHARWSEVWDFKNHVCPEGCYDGPGGIEYDYEEDLCPASRVWFERLWGDTCLHPDHERLIANLGGAHLLDVFSWNSCV